MKFGAAKLGYVRSIWVAVGGVRLALKRQNRTIACHINARIAGDLSVPPKVRSMRASRVSLKCGRPSRNLESERVTLTANALRTARPQCDSAQHDLLDKKGGFPSAFRSQDA